MPFLRKICVVMLALMAGFPLFAQQQQEEQDSLVYLRRGEGVLEREVQALQRLLQGQGELEMMALNAWLSFAHNRDFYRERILAGEAEGVVLHTNTMADLDYPAYDAAIAWMEEHGDEEVE